MPKLTFTDVLYAITMEYWEFQEKHLEWDYIDFMEYWNMRRN